MILNIVAPTAGSVRFDGTDLRDGARQRERLAFMRKVQPIFQNPFEAFNPLKRVDRYLFMTRAALRPARGERRDRGGRRRGAAQGRPVAGRGAAAAFRTSCRAASCSASPSRGR